MRRKTKTIISMVLVAILCLSLLPLSALATDDIMASETTARDDSEDGAQATPTTATATDNTPMPENTPEPTRIPANIFMPERPFSLN